MSRDEMAFKILLTILQTATLRDDIMRDARANSTASAMYKLRPADAYATASYVMADCMIAAGGHLDPVSLTYCEPAQ